jgi:hypothetical protein
MIARNTGFIHALLTASVAVVLLHAATAFAQYTIQCNGSPPPAHVNGLGQVFNDCAPLGVPGNATTYTEAMAQQARAAWPDSGSDLPFTYGPTFAWLALGRQTPKSCAVWAYTGEMAGRVFLNTENNKCYPPGAAEPVWK